MKEHKQTRIKFKNNKKVGNSIIEEENKTKDTKKCGGCSNGGSGSGKSKRETKKTKKSKNKRVM